MDYMVQMFIKSLYNFILIVYLHNYYNSFIYIHLLFILHIMFPIILNIQFLLNLIEETVLQYYIFNKIFKIYLIYIYLNIITQNLL